MSHPHVDLANAYIASVLSGETPACEQVKKACRRQRDDLKRKKWEFTFDADAAERVCTFIELLPHIKGPLAGQRMELAPWQAFVVTTVYGWKHKKTGKRRFRRVYIEVPRGNGKSSLSAPIGLYGLALDDEPGAEVYSGATTRDQAKIVFGIAQEMARQSPKFRRKLGVEVRAHNINQMQSASKFEALSADGHTLDGLNIHYAIIDELHAHKTRDVYDVLETGTGKRDQSLLWVITTAGSDRTGICYELRDYCLQVLSGLHDDESQFAVIYTVDEGDDWRDPNVWRKANPNWGISVRPEIIEQLAKKAEQVPSAQAAFKTKHLDVWVATDNALYPVDKWMELGDPTFAAEDFADLPCIITADLASKSDITCKLKLFIDERPDQPPEFYVFCDHYLPEEAIRESRHPQYLGWSVDGYLQATNGSTTDLQVIEADIVADLCAFRVETVGFDAWQAQYLENRLQERGANVVRVPQTMAQLSEPTKELGALILDERIHHNGDPVLAWMIGNVVGHFDKNDNVKPNKEKADKKIDGAVALVMALNLALRRQTTDSRYNHGGEGIVVGA